MSNERIKWAARFTTVAAVIILIIVFAFITDPVWFMLPIIFSVIVTGAAWLLPELSGLIVIGSVVALVNIFPMNYDIEYKIALIAPWVVFLVGGALYLVTVWRAYRIRKWAHKL